MADAQELEALRSAPYAMSPTEELSPLARRAESETWPQRNASFGRMALLDPVGEPGTAMDIDVGPSAARSAPSTQPTVGFGIQGAPGASCDGQQRG